MHMLSQGPYGEATRIRIDHVQPDAGSAAPVPPARINKLARRAAGQDDDRAHDGWIDRIGDTQAADHACIIYACSGTIEYYTSQSTGLGLLLRAFFRYIVHALFWKLITR